MTFPAIPATIRTAVLVLILLTGTAQAQLFSQPLNTAAQPTGLAPGTQVTYRHLVASHPGPNAGPDARGVAAEGFLMFTVHQWSASGCVVTTRQYQLHPMDGSLSELPSMVVMGTPSACEDFWMAPQALSAPPQASDPNTTVERGPMQAGNRSYDVIFINNDPEQGRPYKRTAHDLETGLLVFMSSGSGDRTWAVAPTMRSESSVYELLDVRTLQYPWNFGEVLPADLSGARSWSFEMTSNVSFPAVNMPGVQSHATIRMDLRRAEPAWALYDVTSSVSVAGAPAQASTSTALVSSGSGHWIPPPVLASLTPGQVIDDNRVIGITTTFESDPSGYVVLASRGRGYTSIAYYDPTSGLQVAVQLEQQNSETLTVTSMWLTAVN